MVDFNARVGRRRDEVERMVGQYGEKIRNIAGEKLIDFCLRKGMKIMNGFFQQRISHRFTRYRWNNITREFDQRSIIDYKISSDSRLTRNVKVIHTWSSNIYSDHSLLLVTDLKVKTD